MTHIVLIIIFAVFIAMGVLGTLIPVVPALPYMLVVALGFGFVDKFMHLTGGELLILTAIAIVSVLSDYFSGIIGARYGGASGKSMIYGFIGILVGTLVLPPFGGLIGLVIGILIGELAQHRDQKRALRAATGGLMGSLAGMLVNLSLAIIFLVLFVLLAI